MFGHGVFVYEPGAVLKKYGSWEGAAVAIQKMKMTHAWIRGHGKDGLFQVKDNQSLVAALRNAGIKVFVWGWCHGVNNLAKDIKNAADAIAKFAPDGYVADIENGVSGAKWTEESIKKFLSATKTALAGKPLILSTHGFIPYHEPELMVAADPYVDAFAPQVYWFWYPTSKMMKEPGAKGHYEENNAASYANLCLDVWRHITKKPIVITGQAYWGESTKWGRLDAEEKLQEFVKGFARYSEIAGLNWWYLAGDAAMSSKMEAMIAAADFQARLDAKPTAASPAPPPVSTMMLAGGAGINPPLAAGGAPATGEAYVRTDGLNLRDAPSTDGKVLKELALGDKVQIIGPASDGRWLEIEAEGMTGFAFGYYIRAPQSDECEALLRSTITEWFRFGKGNGNEKADPYTQFVGEMWRSIGESYDGRSRYANGSDVPWSAAFISFVVRRAGPKYSAFKFAAAHSVFVNDAILARRTQKLNKPFWGFRPSEAAPTYGDIIVRNRAGNSYSYDYAENHSEYVSHSDVVVEVTDGAVKVIGGNLSNGVQKREYQIGPSGLLVPGQNVIAVLKNRAADAA